MFERRYRTISSGKYSRGTSQSKQDHHAIRHVVLQISRSLLNSTSSCRVWSVIYSAPTAWWRPACRTSPTRARTRDDAPCAARSISGSSSITWPRTIRRLWSQRIYPTNVQCVRQRSGSISSSRTTCTRHTGNDEYETRLMRFHKCFLSIFQRRIQESRQSKTAGIFSQVN